MEKSNFREFEPKYGKIYALINLGWIFISIFDQFDPGKWIFLSLMIAGGLLTTYYLQQSRKLNQPLQQTAGVFYLICWLGIATFSNLNELIELLPGFFTSLKQVMYVVLLPVLIVWMQPSSSDRFFGLREASEEDKTKSLWKISVVIIFLLNIVFVGRDVELNQSTDKLIGFEEILLFEIIVLIPLVYEHISLYRLNKEALPILTLHIQRELMHKFAVPISMLKGVSVIMVAFLFEMLNSRLWLIALLGYVFFGIIWMFDFVIPEEMRNSSSDDTDDKEKKRERREKRKAAKKAKREKQDRSPEIKHTEIIKDVEKQSLVEIIEDTTENVEKSRKDVEDLIVSPNAIVGNNLTEKEREVGEKAHALGKRVRTELQKPQYNLNHIMSTLSKEDFNSAYRVHKDGLIFNSTQGEWQPPEDLVLFPLELESYDYRRADEILLLGFNKPIGDEGSKITATWGKDNQHNMKIKGNQIQIGDTTFHMKTLVLSRKDWEAAKQELEFIDDVSDISYTGFTSLHNLQEKLAEISTKWIQLRKQAEIAVVNFAAGLLGSNEPIFVGKDQNPLLSQAKDENYLIEDVDIIDNN